MRTPERYEDSVVLILSAELADEYPMTNLQRTTELETALKDHGLPYQEVEGRYKGVKENSFVVVTKDRVDFAIVMGLARQFEQESVLGLSPAERGERQVETYSLHTGENQHLGELLYVGTGEPEGDWARTKDGRYYQVKGD